MDHNEDLEFRCVVFKICQLLSEVSLDRREGQLNRVVIWRVWWKELAAHAPEYILVSSNSQTLIDKLSPFINHLAYVSGFVDSAIVQHDDRFWTRKDVHLIQETRDEVHEAFFVVRALDDVQGNDPIKS